MESSTIWYLNSTTSDLCQASRRTDELGPGFVGQAIRMMTSATLMHCYTGRYSMHRSLADGFTHHGTVTRMARAGYPLPVQP